MQTDNNSNTDKNRKSEAQKRFDEMDNAGRFAGDDADAQQARSNAEANIRQQASAEQSLPDGGNQDDAIGNAEAHRSPRQSPNIRDEAQNVNADIRRNDNDTEHARNKASGGINEGRDTSGSGNTDMNRQNPGTKGS